MIESITSNLILDPFCVLNLSLQDPSLRPSFSLIKILKHTQRKEFGGKGVHVLSYYEVSQNLLFI